VVEGELIRERGDHRGGRGEITEVVGDITEFIIRERSVVSSVRENQGKWVIWFRVRACRLRRKKKVRGLSLGLGLR
jgi:hypothetical protein